MLINLHADRLAPATKASCNIVVTGNAIVCLFSAFDAQRIIQQLREAFPEAGPYRHAIFDHDSTFNDDIPLPEGKGMSAITAERAAGIR